MTLINHLPGNLDLPADLITQLMSEAVDIATEAYQKQRTKSLPKVGQTLRPGKATPLWNTLRDNLKPYLKKHGSQAELGRLLCLPRQQVNAFVAGTRMPDAERTLQLIAWLVAKRNGENPESL